MIIASSSISLASAHQWRASVSSQESLNFWVGDRRPAARGTAGPENLPAPPPPPTGAAPSVSRPTLPAPKCKCATAEGKKTSAAEEDAAETSLDPTTRLMKRIIEKMFGGKIHLASVPKESEAQPLPTPPPEAPPQTPDGPKRQGWGLEYQFNQVREESEQMQFDAAGVVRTADGQEIKFSLAVNMQRYSRQEESFALKAGDALIDPLVLNFDGPAAQLRSGNFDFDLNSDGHTEKLPLLGSGTAFLALDRNQDGQINNGSELFGPATGQGFAELNALDTDGNGWIDEGDAGYGKLSLWQPAADGKGQLQTLKEKNVGAIYLQSAATPFTYQNEAQETQARLSTSSIFLQENGAVGTVQQLDFVA